MVLRIVNYVVFEVTGVIGIADTDFTNSKSETISNVGRRMRGCARTMCHHDADKLRWYGAISKPNS